MYLAAGILALGRRREPWSAVVLKQRHLNDPDLYADIFSNQINLQLLAPIVFALRTADSVLEEVRPRATSEGFLKKNRYTLALLSVARKFGTFNYTDRNLISLAGDAHFIELVRDTLVQVPQAGQSSGRKKTEIVSACQELADKCGVDGIKRIQGAKQVIQGHERVQKLRRSADGDISEILLAKILSALPPQPWKPGLHSRIMEQVNCTGREYFAAVEKLIKAGHFLRQVDGVLYSADGSVHSYDHERVRIDESGFYVLIAQTAAV
ncbi:MAG: hypothetical protein IPL70_17325 [Uliginosibacterium sp.]|nr:hypothetical protein [Uliginosibacterium sp.]